MGPGTCPSFAFPGAQHLSHQPNEVSEPSQARTTLTHTDSYGEAAHHIFASQIGQPALRTLRAHSSRNEHDRTVSLELSDTVK